MDLDPQPKTSSGCGRKFWILVDPTGPDSTALTSVAEPKPQGAELLAGVDGSWSSLIIIAVIGAGSGVKTFLKQEPEPELKQIVRLGHTGT
jgi:inactivated superfamily I helicase